ncbi:S-layer homology domain-containing protein [Paenibacillus hexagrammi]|uniref:S-layer homology domain-containing protein n=1 Tax=Paenibacillus hexagrammi TaxID=2908839 RepID=A0ABY3SHP0_9BACL|nr:S-layer homology domain-containing protein [Paenibacillus sp. YPD9-1]UJF32895.1 S-layer homology domain-containing protein [Paenibacillus sp. YPD9-1]
MEKPRKRAKTALIVTLALAVGMIGAGKEKSVYAEAASAQGKFNMSYMYFGSPSSYVSQVDKSGQTLNVVSPSYFHLNEDGTLQISDIDKSFITEMHNRGIKVVPFLSNDFDRAIGQKGIDQRNALVKQIVAAVKANNLDGIDVDIENVSETYRDAFTDLVRQLHNQLPASAEVSVAVAANPSGTTKGWVAAFDYKALADVSDYLMLMAYDESYPGDPTPGPVASLPFVEKSIQYALKQIPSSKLVLGVPFYGRYWNQDAASNGAGLSNLTIEKLIQTYKGTVAFDTASQSPKVTFTIHDSDPSTTVNGKKLPSGSYTVWYENEQSLKAKLELVKKYNLKGTGSWSLNQETASTWNYYALWADGFYFTDMQTHWAQADVLAAANRGWMLGTATDTFAPDAALTRAEAAVILVRALGLKSDASTASAAASFKDVPVTHWARQEIAIAKQSGLIQGISDSRFAPDQPITREEMAALLSRVVKTTSPGATSSSAKTSFSDVPASSWSYDAITAMSRMGVVEGFPSGTFRPKASLTRAEMAALLGRVAPLLGK